MKKVKNVLHAPHKIDDAFSAAYTYDPAGNLLSLQRNGWVEDYQDFRLIDDLDYTYESNTSELKKVEDLIQNIDPLAQPKGFGVSDPISNYTYDANGNLITDSGKDLEIEYNLLNLPTKITRDNDEMFFEYTYGAEKIQKAAPDVTRDYVGAAEYVDEQLELIHIPNGRIIHYEEEIRYQYYITDHLGNLVVLFEDKNDDGMISIEEEAQNEEDLEIIQRNFYYSFGLRANAPHFLPGETPKNQYLYNGKELEEELGLEWLSYGFRMYDPAIGRFPSVDPIADQFAWVSPFNYTENEPVGHIDLWGLQKNAPPKINYKSGSKVLDGVNQTIKSGSWYVARGAEAAFNYFIAALDLLPDPGSTNAEDFHDKGNTEIKGPGVEMMTGDDNLPTAGTLQQNTSEKGADAIIDNLAKPSAGNKGGEIRNWGQPFNFLNRTGDIINKVDEVKNEVGAKKKEESLKHNPVRQQDTIYSGQNPDAPNQKLTITKPEEGTNDNDN